MDHIQAVWKDMFGNEPFVYEFVDNTFKRVYKVDIQFSQFVLFFTLLAIFIACLGLFGLTAFSTEQRTKEIGIRKAMGASVLRINNLIIKQYTRWVLWANLVAWPLAWYAMNKWLHGYAYKIELNITYFLVATLVVFMIALLTVSYQSIKAAKTNPVDSLRYE
jgi:putative ABC transport system permease protein